MKYYIKTYGCQMNHSDSERIASILQLAKFTKTPNESDADLIVINMCSVRKSAVDRIAGNFKKYNKFKKNNPQLKTIITGCILKNDRKKFEKLFDLVLDIKEIEKLPDKLNNKTASSSPAAHNCIDNNYNYFHIQPQNRSKITAYVPIMTGCNNFCSYCVVPYTRGREYSRPAKEIIDEITELTRNGYKEIILLGQNVNSYNPGENTDFPKLLELINNISGNFWIRFLTSHPKDVSEKLIKTVATCEKCTEYIHLALQSGDDKILEKMNRKYTAEHFLDLIKMIRKNMPDAAITTDVIVGFPGETEKQFQNTAEVMKKAKFDMVYINKYSPREGTASAKMKDNISLQKKKIREKILTEILKETALENNQRYIGKIIDVLVEKIEDNYAYGKTMGFKNIKIKSRTKNKKPEIKEGEFVKIKITQANAWGLEGRIN